MSLILKNTRTGEELKALKYAQPTKATEGTATINGAEVATKFTSGRGNSYTYFLLNNVSLYVKGALEAGVDHTIEVPEGFGADAPPEGKRKSYYKPKRVKKDAPAGEGESNADQKPDGAQESGAGAEVGGSQDAGADGGEPASQEGQGEAAPRQRRKRGE